MEADILKPMLFLDGNGNRVCKCQSEPQCRRCGTRIKKNETIYFCSSSKDVYCSKCEHDKKHWNCKVGDYFNDEHIDWMCTLEIKTNEVRK